MFYGVGQTVRFRARFKASGVAPGALTVVITVRDTDGTAVVNAQAATSLGDGFYGYDAYVATEVGPLVFFFNATAGTVDVQQQEGVAEVVPWLDSNGLVKLAATQTTAITGNITGNLSGSVGSVTGNVGGNVTGSVGSVTGLTASAIVTALFGTDVETGESFVETLRLFRAALAGLTESGGTGITNFLRADEATTAFAATVNSTTNLRTAITIGDLT